MMAACILCAVCKRWIRPEEMNEECNGMDPEHDLTVPDASYLN